MKSGYSNEGNTDMASAKKRKISNDNKVGNKPKFSKLAAPPTASNKAQIKSAEVKKNPKLLLNKTKSKARNNDKSKLLQKPASWSEFKKEKKELKQKRKTKRGLIEIITQAKAIGEKIRVKKLEGGTAERTKLINNLHELLGNQGSYVKFVLSHDMARIVQYMLKFGSSSIRENISLELIPETVQMLQSNYGKFVVKRMLRYGNNNIRARCIRACYGNAVKLACHAVSAPVFEYAYSEFSSPADKICLVQEFFGDMYKQTKDINIKHLRYVYAESKDIKAAVLSATKANLGRILNKDLLDSAMVQTVLAQFMDECSDADRTELISQLASHIVVISNSKDGARAAMTCFWHGTNKERKIMVKAMKEHITDMCKHEHAHTAVIAIIDSADDTVLLGKTILSEIVSKADDLIQDDWGRRVLAWIVSPCDTKHFHPRFISELNAGRDKSCSKKDADVRRQEVCNFCIKPLLEKISSDPAPFCSGVKQMLVSSLLLRHAGASDNASTTFASVAKFVVDLERKIGNDLYIENGGIHVSLKKLVQNDYIFSEGASTFGAAIVSSLTSEILKVWLNTNRGCFLLADIYSNNAKVVQQELKTLLEPYNKLIKSQGTKGSELLLEKIVS